MSKRKKKGERERERVEKNKCVPKAVTLLSLFLFSLPLVSAALFAHNDGLCTMCTEYTAVSVFLVTDKG